MSALEERVEPRQAAPLPVEQRRITPIKWFAAAGALCWGMEIYLFTRWLAAGPSATPAGPDHDPAYMKVAAVCMEVISPLMLLGVLYWLVIRPWRRLGSIQTNGLLALAILGTWWQDMAFNYFNPAIAVNTAFVNAGSWYGYIPGWVSPHGSRLVEPVIFTGPVFVWAIALPAMAVCALMRKTRERWPRMGTFGLLMVAIVTAAVLDCVYEVPFSHLGLYTYVGSIPALTLFAGHFYQFPVYEAVLFGVEFAALGALLYFKDDRGYTVAERGVDRLNVSARARTFVRFLALTGFAGLVYLFYNISFGSVSLLPSFKWAGDVAHHRSYLRDGICGPGTGYACPSANVPIPRVGGAHVAPDGKLVIPKGRRFP